MTPAKMTLRQRPLISALTVLAGIMGASGIALAAAAAHAAPGAGLDSAAYLLLLHAVAVLALAAGTGEDRLWPPLGLTAMVGFVLGSCLFAADLALRAFAGHRFFPMAAPLGGTILIVSWLVLAAAPLVMLARSR
jgi:uncharacterized membrane protein YgdD (TMEM256/DUF423 family)